MSPPASALSSTQPPPNKRSARPAGLGRWGSSTWRAAWSGRRAKSAGARGAGRAPPAHRDRRGAGPRRPRDGRAGRGLHRRQPAHPLPARPRLDRRPAGRQASRHDLLERVAGRVAASVLAAAGIEARPVLARACGLRRARRRYRQLQALRLLASSDSASARSPTPRPRGRTRSPSGAPRRGRPWRRAGSPRPRTAGRPSARRSPQPSAGRRARVRAPHRARSRRGILSAVASTSAACRARPDDRYLREPVLRQFSDARRRRRRARARAPRPRPRPAPTHPAQKSSDGITSCGSRPALPARGSPRRPRRPRPRHRGPEDPAAVPPEERLEVVTRPARESSIHRSAI